jgi:hypothetical protein
LTRADRKMKKPAVLAIGGRFVKKIEKTAIIMVSTESLEFANGLLIGYYYILDATYPDALINVFFFFVTSW